MSHKTPTFKDFNLQRNQKVQEHHENPWDPVDEHKKQVVSHRKHTIERW